MSDDINMKIHFITIGTKAVPIKFDTFTFPTLLRGKGPIERWGLFLFFGKQNLDPKKSKIFK